MSGRLPTLSQPQPWRTGGRGRCAVRASGVSASRESAEEGAGLGGNPGGGRSRKREQKAVRDSEARVGAGKRSSLPLRWREGSEHVKL